VLYNVEWQDDNEERIVNDLKVVLKGMRKTMKGLSVRKLPVESSSAVIERASTGSNTHTQAVIPLLKAK
jgi:hypothetical protein